MQSKSKNKETYKDDNAKNELIKKLLKNEFSTSEELEILFGMKFSDDNIERFNKNTIPKIIDIKI